MPPSALATAGRSTWFRRGRAVAPPRERSRKSEGPRLHGDLQVLPLSFSALGRMTRNQPAEPNAADQQNQPTTRDQYEIETGECQNTTATRGVGCRSAVPACSFACDATLALRHLPRDSPLACIARPCALCERGGGESENADDGGHRHHHFHCLLHFVTLFWSCDLPRFLGLPRSLVLRTLPTRRPYRVSIRQSMIPDRVVTIHRQSTVDWVKMCQ